MNTNPDPDRPARCPCCGGESLTAGKVTGYGELQFFKTGKPGLKPASQQITRARRCDTCGNVQLFLK